MWEYRHTDELYHYGVPGMKWGERKKYYKQGYRNAKREYERTLRSEAMAVSADKTDKTTRDDEKINKANFDVVKAKAKYAASKKKDKEKAYKAEFKTYVKEMRKSQMPNDDSYVDSNRSADFYNRLKKEKGQAYADKVMKKVRNEKISDVAALASLAVGMKATGKLLETKYKENE